MKALHQLAKAFQSAISGLFEAKGKFPFGSCIISYSFNGRNTEVEVYNPVKDTYLDNIASFLKELVQPQDDDSDVWSNHGFSGSEDYYRFRL